MLFFGHIGITAGAAKACDILLSMTKPGDSLNPNSSLKFDTTPYSKWMSFHELLNGAEGQINSIDYRLVLLGSLLPDIIDKPVWFLLGSDTSLSGRGYAHTLLFSLALLIGGLVLLRYRKSWLFILSLSSFMHLILDQIWNSPVILLWPLLGPLPSADTTGWLSGRFQGLFLYPEVYIPEIIGLLVVMLLTYRLVKGKRVTVFLKDGVVV